MTSTPYVVDLDNVISSEFPSVRKGNATRFVSKHLQEGVHYVKVRHDSRQPQWGGHNAVKYMLTTEAKQLLVNTFRSNVTYAPDRQAVTIMSLENQTVGIIYAAFMGVVEVVRQYTVGQYRMDLCFVHHKLGVECDEMGHADRNADYEKRREDFLLGRGYMLIRTNPKSPAFDLARVLHRINRVVISGDWVNQCVRLD